MSTTLPYLPRRELLPTFSNHQCTSSHAHAETDSSSNFRIHTAFGGAALQQRNIVMASQLDPDVYGVQVYDIDLHHLPKIGWLDVDHQFYVKISIDDGTTRLTSQEKPSSMPWTGKHAFDVRDSTILTLKVFAHRKHHPDQYIGMVQGRVEQFLEYPGAVIEQLTGSKEERLRASLEFKIASIVGLGRPAQRPNDPQNGDYVNGLRSSHSHLDAVPPAVQIFDIDLHHLPRIGLVSAEKRQFYVHTFVDERNHESAGTTAEKLHSLPWTTKLQLNVRASSTISFKVFAKRLVHEDEYIGMVRERVSTLLAHPGTKIYRLVSSEGHDDKIPLRASMEFKVVPLNHAIEDRTSQLAENQLAQETDDISSMPGAGGDGLIGQLNEHIQQAAGVVAVASVFPPLLKKIDIFVQLAGRIRKTLIFLTHP
ncbi:hypothetical protein K503DRAFT_780783 [Rhizopogon vinicolor AM-OR11-026]|uniref:C2 domain-containing protein n=1 Tax=Rhizopogon vinicolor AM-OR11-026 TaxID=1314800 RepID=A0A1B7N8U5_9AGAM|nr:hypothetical protein K503DRAFT_780783 [Rhizopogon vinicolor AM-OR11-026]